MPAPELLSPIAIPQPQSPFEKTLEVPSVHVEKFQALTRAVYEASESATLPHIIAAVAIDDREISQEILVARVQDLGRADQYIRENPGEPFVNADRTGLTAGNLDNNKDLVVIPWNSTIDYGTGLAIPSRARVEFDFSGFSIMGMKAETPIKEHVNFITPDTVVTSENVEATDIAERFTEGGVLAVGQAAVDAFKSAIGQNKSTENGHLFQAMGIALSILQVARRSHVAS